MTTQYLQALDKRNDDDGQWRELAASLPLALAPLITRWQKWRVLHQVLRRAKQHAKAGSLPPDFFKNYVAMARDLDKAVRRKFGSSPIFAPIRYVGALSADLSPSEGIGAYMRFPNTIVLTEQATLDAIPHELTHYLTDSYIHSPALTRKAALPFYQYYGEPSRRREVARKLADVTAKLYPDVEVPPGYFEEYMSEPGELLAFTVASRIPGTDERYAKILEPVLEPQFEPLIEYLTDLIAPLR